MKSRLSGCLLRAITITRWIARKLHRDRNILWTKRMVYVTAAIVSLTYFCHRGRFPKGYDFIQKDSIPQYLAPQLSSSQEGECIYEGGRIQIKNALAKLKNSFYSVDDSNMTREWKNQNCSPRKVAIVVPYRDRKEQLDIFLPYMHWFLQSQLLDYHIYVVEQSEKQEFNRALLFNIGFVEAQKRENYPCFIFHDVDLLPENLENIYACTKYPRHMSACVNTMRYVLLYRSLFGGVVSLLSRQFELVNGFPNRYFGWGGEDDDLSLRISNKNLAIYRFPPQISKYTMLPHKQSVPNAKRLELLERGTEDQDTDGLSSLDGKYKVLNTDNRLRYTMLHVDIL